MKYKIQTKHLCVIALAIVINLIGSQIALAFRLPIYLDSMGTMLIAAIYGPFLGAIPSLVSGFILGITIDIYSLYYAPVGILLGLLTGWICKSKNNHIAWIAWATFLITIPTSIVGSFITANLFGGITSSGSTYLVQLLAKTPLGLTASCFLVQVITDYIDRFVTLVLVLLFIKKIPDTMLQKLKSK